MRSLYNIIKKTIIGVGVAIMYVIISSYLNKCICEEIVTIPSEMLESLKQRLVEGLTTLTQDPLFRAKYKTGSVTVFGVLYLDNTVYIQRFVESLPLTDIINNFKYESINAIINYIIELFQEDLARKKAKYLDIVDKVIHFKVIMDILDHMKFDWELQRNIERGTQQLLAIYAPLQDGIYTPAMTEPILERGEKLMRILNDQQAILDTNYRLGFEFFAKDNGEYNVRILIKLHEKYMVFSEIQAFFRVKPIFEDSIIGFYFSDLKPFAFSCQIKDIIVFYNYLKS